jgi:hypothetical protein
MIAIVAVIRLRSHGCNQLRLSVSSIVYIVSAYTSADT